LIAKRGRAKISFGGSTRRNRQSTNGDFNLTLTARFLTCGSYNPNARQHVDLSFGVLSVASKSDGFVVSSDMASLLDLLSSSESRCGSAEDAEPRANVQVDEVPEVEPTMILPARQDAVNLASSPEKIMENRFAEYIVHGMSKLNRP
jgi:hypothetical protein